MSREDAKARKKMNIGNRDLVRTSRFRERTISDADFSWDWG